MICVTCPYSKKLQAYYEMACTCIISKHCGTVPKTSGCKVKKDYVISYYDEEMYRQMKDSVEE